MDVYHRLHADEDDFFIAYDLEISNEELNFICKKGEQWRGEEGERRKTAVYDYIWEEEQVKSDGGGSGVDDSDKNGDGGIDDDSGGGDDCGGGRDDQDDESGDNIMMIMMAMMIMMLMIMAMKMMAIKMLVCFALVTNNWTDSLSCSTLITDVNCLMFFAP